MQEQIVAIPSEDDENEHIIELWTPCEFKIDKKYEYVKTGKLFNIASNILYYGIAIPVLSLLLKIIYDFKIEGKENIDKIEGGAVSISNHVLFLDCAMIGIAFKKRKNYYTTQEDSFKIPVVRKLIKLLRAIPIPLGIENKKIFIKEINKLLKEGKIVHFYPESSLRPYEEKIRKFKNGAFDFAVKNQVSVIPCVFEFRNPKGIRKILKKKKDVTLKILEPIKAPEDIISQKEKTEWIKNKAKTRMERKD